MQGSNRPSQPPSEQLLVVLARNEDNCLFHFPIDQRLWLGSLENIV